MLEPSDFSSPPFKLLCTAPTAPYFHTVCDFNVTSVVSDACSVPYHEGSVLLLWLPQAFLVRTQKDSKCSEQSHTVHSDANDEV